VTENEEPQPHVVVSVVVLRALKDNDEQAAHVIVAFPFARLRPESWLQLPKANAPDPKTE